MAEVHIFLKPCKKAQNNKYNSHKISSRKMRKTGLGSNTQGASMILVLF